MTQKEIEEIVSRVLSALGDKEEAQKPQNTELQKAAEETPKFPIIKPLRERISILITEEVLRKLAPNGGTVLVEGKYIVTPSAADFIRKVGITLKNVESFPVMTSNRSVRPEVEKILAIGSDHRGFQLKKFLSEELRKLGFNILDMGTNKPETCDYPDFAAAVAKAVATGEARFGIIIDSAGIGSSIAANKVKGIRAALCWDIDTAQRARLHNDANILCLGADMIAQAKALEMAKTFIFIEYVQNPRYDLRIEKIKKLEQ